MVLPWWASKDGLVSGVRKMRRRVGKTFVSLLTSHLSQECYWGYADKDKAIKVLERVEKAEASL